MESFYLTFGSQYPHSDFWVRIDAPDYETARRAAFEVFDRRWSMVYSAESFKPVHFRAGELYAFSTDEDLNFRRLTGADKS